MPTPETTFNALGGIMQAFQESLLDKSLVSQKLEQENAALKATIADLGQKLLAAQRPVKGAPEFELEEDEQ